VVKVFTGMAKPADKFDVDDSSNHRVSRRVVAPFLVRVQFGGIFNQTAACLALSAAFRQKGLPKLAPPMLT
jgi:hypothetical protein